MLIKNRFLNVKFLKKSLTSWQLFSLLCLFLINTTCIGSSFYNMKGIIYKTTNLITGKIYIGQYTGLKQNYLGSGTYILRVIKKYGKENFKREILEICQIQEQLDFNEEYYIELYNSTNPNIGYNLSKKALGVHKGYKNNKEHNQKIKEFRLTYKFSKESKRQMSLSKYKPIYQLNSITEEIIQEWPSTLEVYKVIKNIDIYSCLRGHQNIAGGFKWKYKNQLTPEFIPKYIPKKVYQIDLITNQIIKIWDNFKQIENNLNWQIDLVFRKNKRISHNYLWLYKEEYKLKINNCVDTSIFKY